MGGIVTIAERFDLGERIGSGAMGMVHRAFDRATGGEVALKLLHGFQSDEDARFQRECELLAAIDHPGVVRYVAHGRASDDRPFLAMEWVEGRTLSSVIKEAPLDVHATVEVIAHLAEAVGALHARGIVHRDLKPANVILAGGRVTSPKLVDFGIAFSSRQPDGLTAPGIMIGSPGYMAPEQARGETDVDARADVFALGCLVFKCLTGQTPFVGDVVTILLKLAVEACPKLSERAPRVPGQLDDLVARMLSRRRDDRPTDAGEVARALFALRATDLDVRPSQNPPVLGTTEVRVSSIVIGRLRPGGATAGDPRELVPGLAAELEQVRARLTVLADGTLAVTFDEPYDSATDLAGRGVRAALTLRATFPDVQAVVATGRAVDAGRTLVGQVIERASSLLGEVSQRGHRGMIALDSTTTHLVETSYLVLPFGAGGRLIGERDVESVRELLGRPSPFVGRDRELAGLGSAIEECAAARRARVALVVGQAGIGKSRLRFEATSRLDPAGFEVWTARCDPMSRRSPFGVLGQILYRAAGIVRGEKRESSWEKLHGRVEVSLAVFATRLDARELAARTLDVAEFLGELAGIPRPGKASLALEAARRDRGLLRDRMRLALETFCSAELARRPVVVALEDLQWADTASLALFGVVLRQLAARPLFVLATARPDFDESLFSSWSGVPIERMPLTPLDDAAARALCGAALGGRLSDPEVDALIARAGGNAFFLEELIRNAAQGGGRALPESVLATVESRLDALPPEARRVLRAASMFGQWCWEGGIRALVGGAQLRGHLALLTERELLARRTESRFEGQTEYAFRSAVVAETAYAMIPDEDRARGHAVIARWLADVRETEPAVLAEHLERGGAPEAAADQWALAAERAADGHDLDRAIELAERGLRHVTRGATAGRLFAVRAEVALWRGDNASAARDAELGARELEPGAPEWCAAATTCVTGAGRIGDRARVLAMVERVLGLAEHVERRTSHVVLLAQCAIQTIFAGHLALADALLSRIEGADDAEPRALAWLTRARAWRAISAGDIGRYGDWMRRSAECFGLIGDVRNQWVQRVNVAYADLSLGRVSESVAGFEEVVSTTRAMGLDTVTPVALHNLGYALALLGRLDEADRVEREALDSFVAHGDLRMTGTTRMYLAMIAMMRGDSRSAVAEAKAALASATQEGPSRAIALATMAAMLLARGGSVSDALNHAREAQAMLDEMGGVDEGEALIRLTYARCLHAAGALPEAKAAIVLARERLHERASLIEAPELRRSFLEQLPDHVLTASLAEEWSL